MYTRCPKCSTCFRVTERHLAIAKGKVRCGKCQLVFNATENAIDDLPNNSTGSQTINTPVTPTAKTEIKKPVSRAQSDKVAAVPPPKVAPPLYKADASIIADPDDDLFDKDFDLDAAINELTEHADEITYDHDITDKKETTAKIEPEPSNSEKKQSNDVFTTDAYDATNASSVADIFDEMEGQLALNIPEPDKEIKKKNMMPMMNLNLSNSMMNLKK